MNFCLQTDSYKLTHFKQYPPLTQYVYSYLESRGGLFPDTTFFGGRYYTKKYLAGKVFNGVDIENARKFAEAHFGRKDCFNYAGWYALLNKYGGYLPIKIRAVPEGTTVQNHNVLMTIENTDAEFPWLTNYVETILLKLWYPITVCTLSRHIKKIIRDAHVATGSALGGLDFKLHDFGYRGASSEESAAIGAAAHLVNFKGSDTLAGIDLLQDYYGATEMPGFSIPAAEHSTITSWGKENEEGAFRNMITQWPTGLVAVVSDSYDLNNAVDNLWGRQLHQEVIDRDGTVVVRPDSGDPVYNVLYCLETLFKRFGGHTNQDGYRLLNQKVRVIQGDGIDFVSINQILEALKYKKWAAENVAFGMGGALLQKLDRDTQKFAIKCSEVVVDGKSREVFKEAPGKSSKRGRLALLPGVNDAKQFHTFRRVPGFDASNDVLQTVFENGEMKNESDLDEIRLRAAI